MTEITITLNDPAKTVELLKEAARHASGTGWDHTSAQHAHWLANKIEEQVKPAIEEPSEFGSIVRAAALLWQKSPMHGKHYWECETGAVDVWSDLVDVEVLRVGIGEAAPTDADEFMVSAGFSPRIDMPEETSDYMYGVRDTITAAVHKLRMLRGAQITAERQNVCDKAIAVVEGIS